MDMLLLKRYPISTATYIQFLCLSACMTGHSTLKAWELTSPMTFAILVLAYLLRLRRERAHQQFRDFFIFLHIMRLDVLFGFMQKQYEETDSRLMCEPHSR